MRPARTTSIARRQQPLAVLIVLAASVVLAACGGPSEAGAALPTPLGPAPDALGSPLPIVGTPAPGVGTPAPGEVASGSPGPSVDPIVEICERLTTVQARLVDLAALELRPTARVTLDIELSRIQAAFSDMRQDVLEGRDPRLDEPLRQLGYRLDDLALAVEDFRTTPRPRDAASHVADEAVVFGDALGGFILLVGC